MTVFTILWFAGGGTRAIDLDIPKAFDKVWHSGLLHKLKSYGVISPILSILESFLQERSLKVVLDSQSSPLISLMLEFPRDQFWANLIPGSMQMTPLSITVLVSLFVLRRCNRLVNFSQTCVVLWNWGTDDL